MCAHLFDFSKLKKGQNVCRVMAAVVYDATVRSISEGIIECSVAFSGTLMRFQLNSGVHILGHSYGFIACCKRPPDSELLELKRDLVVALKGELPAETRREVEYVLKNARW